MNFRRSHWRLPRRAPAGLRITRSAHGVPHIEAPELSALLWGLGYCHARDRGLHMLLMRLAGHGRLAECLDGGDEAAEADLFFRRHAFPKRVHRCVGDLEPTVRRALEAYAAGVNARFRRSLPMEVRLVGYRPEPWAAGDCLLLSRLIGYVGLAQTQADLERFVVEMVQAGVSDEGLSALFPDVPEIASLSSDDPSLPSRQLLSRVRLGERLVPTALRWLSPIASATASNNWAVSPSRSQSGNALLANDPHLEINRLPNVWYEAVTRLTSSDEHYVITCTMPGLPAPLLGRSRDVAWGATYAYVDAIDSWIEDCKSGRRREGRDYVPFQQRHEEIKRKGRAPMHATFYESQHGVLDGDPHRSGYLLSTRWAGAESGVQSLEAMYAMWTASSATNAMQHLGRVETAWNWVVADRTGNIGYQMSGLVPRRRPGTSGLLPLPGWDPINDWRGFEDVDALPRQVNPERGFLVTANEELNHLGRAKPQNATMPDYRARRIAQVLERKPQLSLQDCQELQYDTLSLQAQAFLEVLLPLLPDAAEARELRDWDGRYDRRSTGAVLFEAFYHSLTNLVLGQHVLGEAVLAHLVNETALLGSFFGHVDRVLLDPPPKLCGGQTRDQLYRRAFAEACKAPRRPGGRRVSVRLHHLFFGTRVPDWTGLAPGPLTLSGGRASVNQTQVLRVRGRTSCVAASVRFVTDLGEDALYSVLLGGPSDRRFSRWYASELQAWLSGRYKRLGPEPNAAG